jgi:hypothetical protein
MGAAPGAAAAEFLALLEAKNFSGAFRRSKTIALFSAALAR